MKFRDYFLVIFCTIWDFILEYAVDYAEIVDICSNLALFQPRIT